MSPQHGCFDILYCVYVNHSLVYTRTVPRGRASLVYIIYHYRIAVSSNKLLPLRSGTASFHLIPTCHNHQTIAGRMVTHLPPFHPDHPHNHPQYQSQYQYQRSGGTTPLGQTSLNLPFTTAPTTPPRRIGFKTKMSVEEMSDASLSPKEDRTCFCGNVIKDGEGIYCSAGELFPFHVIPCP